MKTAISIFKPHDVDDHKVRSVVMPDGGVYFVLRDALAAMGSTTTTNNAKDGITNGIGAEHVSTVALIDSLGRTQTATVISEEALVYLILRSGTKSAELKAAALKRIRNYKEILSALDNFEVPDDLPDMYVYAIREVDTGNIKLGISQDPEQRLKTLQTGNSSELELVAFRKAEKRFAEERAIHADAQAYHLRNEWFQQQALEALQ